MSSHTISVSHDCKLADGRELNIEYERVIDIDRDRHYGSDADGNRGIDQTFYDDMETRNVMVHWYDDDDNASKPVDSKTLPAADQKEIDGIIDAYNKKHPPEDDLGDEDEDDPPDWLDEEDYEPVDED